MDNEFTILPVSPADFIANWSVVEPLLDAAMPVMMRRYLTIDLLAMTIQQQAQGWFIRDKNDIVAVILTRIDNYPRLRGLNIFAISGSRMNEWFEPADKILTQYARQMGCLFLEVQGRRGWERVLDLEPRSTFLVKDLTINNEQAGGQ